MEKSNKDATCICEPGAFRFLYAPDAFGSVENLNISGLHQMKTWMF
jgi:hypothetical protein